ncbi:methyl-accepting chemotaxis protein [Eubacterium oxidoreducens]|uniref:Methyl-accepting chemotaxis protein n=1 Tax=Eubacterium oxidoreducens TaxID=1732 RepID=A0A1G6AF24_EUBOX|nr:methyl-accepting chemotaxis protein [Eubacterium oxidoreducens]SDB06906.1 Methyl-accepting chemotaxis protein [Eubacterium oxidoreducens]
MKNAKLATKISLIVVIVLAICLAVLAVITNNLATNAMTQATQMRMREATEARAQVIDDYIEYINAKLVAFSRSDEVRNVLTNYNEDTYQEAQDYLDRIAADYDYMEGLFVNRMDTCQIVHNNPDAINGYEVEDGVDEYLAEILGTSPETGIPNFYGIRTSPATGQQVLVSYCSVLDDNGKELGYVGCGITTTGFLETVSALTFHGLDNAQLMIIDTSSNSFVYCPDEDKIGSEVDNDGLLKLSEKAAASSEAINGSDDGDSNQLFYNSIPEYNLLICVLDSTEEIYSSTTHLSHMVILMCVIVAVAIAIITILVVSKLVKDLSKVSTIIKHVADTMDMTPSEELSHYAERGDEVGYVSKATIALTGAVNQAASALQARGKQLFNTAEQLSNISNQSLMSVEQVEEAVREIAEGATSQAGETERANDNVNEIGSQINDAADVTNNIMTTSESMKESSLHVTEVIEQLISIGEKTTEAINEIYEQTNTTNHSATQIQNATEIITSIAEETNLLSLNASIEAARAGEQGKGFAVVATQIQKLAEQSSASAQQIENVIATLLADSNKSVATMENVKEIMAQQAEYVQKTGVIFAEVREGIDKTLSGLEEISRRTNSMNDSRRNVVDIVENLSAIAEENAASTEETSASASLVNELMQNISESAENVAHIAEDMEQELSVFKL